MYYNENQEIQLVQTAKVGDSIASKAIEKGGDVDNFVFTKFYLHKTQKFV